jgi:phosphoribosyl 1,2-cyclic phosphodiesterase
VDAGLGPREMAERLQDVAVDPASLLGVLISHEHGDHARGAAAFARRWGVPLYGSRGTYAAAGLGAEAIPSYEVLPPSAPTAIGAFTVTAIPIPHDAAAPYAFVVEADGCSLGHATDLGHVGASLVRAFLDCDTVLVESNHDLDLLQASPYPWSVKDRISGWQGHLSNEDVAGYLARGLGERCRRVVLAHLSRKCNDPALAEAVADAALRSRGRTEVAVTLCAEDGTAWLDIAPSALPRRGPQQLRLW